MWDLGSGAVLRECPSTGNSSNQQITSLTFSRDGTLLASSSYGNQIKLWNVRTLSTTPQSQIPSTRYNIIVVSHSCLDFDINFFFITLPRLFQ